MEDEVVSELDTSPEPEQEAAPEPEQTETATEQVAEETETKPDPIEDLRKDYESKLEQTRKEAEEARKEVARLGYALRKTKSDEKPKEEAPQFSDAQLLAIMQEHKDDPNVMLQVFKEISKSAAKGAEVNAVKSAELQTKLSNINAIVKNQYAKFTDESTEEYKAVQSNKEFLNLQDHPFGEYLAIAALHERMLPKYLENAKEEGRKEALSKKADETRKEGIKQTTPAKSGKTEGNKTASALTITQQETAKRLGLTSKEQIARYLKMVGAKSNTYTTA